MYSPTHRYHVDTPRRYVLSGGHPETAPVPGGEAPPSTRCTRGASPTERRRRSATSPASARACAYLRDLGVDAIWFSPWYPSPMADAGYDVADYRDIDPAFGTLGRGRAADRRGARARHPDRSSTSSRTTAPTGIRGSGRRWPRRPGLARARPVLVPARPRAERRAAAERLAVDFGGTAWTRTRTRRTPASGTCTCSPPSSPTSTGTHPDVRAEHEDILRFWFDRGVDGVRIDSAALLVKDPALPDFDPDDAPAPHPFTDRDEVHEVYRAWRRDRRLLRRAAR